MGKQYIKQLIEKYNKSKFNVELKFYINEIVELAKKFKYYPQVIDKLKEWQYYISPEYLKCKFSIKNYQQFKKRQKFLEAQKNNTVTDELIIETFETEEKYLDYLNDIYFTDCIKELDNHLIKMRELVLKTVDNYKIMGNKKYIKEFGIEYEKYFKEYKKFTKLKPPKGYGEEYKIAFNNAHGNSVKGYGMFNTFFWELDEDNYLKAVEYIIRGLDSRRYSGEIVRLISMYGKNWNKHTNKTLLPEVIEG